MSSYKEHLHRFIAFNGLRGIACFVVVRLHAGKTFNPSILLPHAHMAVDFFFALSGFVVAHAYEKKLTNSMRFVDFVKILLLRLYPMIFLGAALGVFVLAVRVVATNFPTMHQLLIVTLCANAFFMF